MKLTQFTLAALAKKTNAKAVGDPNFVITGVESLDVATNQDVSFFANLRYKEAMLKSKAGIICINQETPLIKGKNFLISDDPSKTFQKIVELFFSDEELYYGFTGIHPTAVIHPKAVVDPTVQVGPYVVIDAGAVIGKGTRLFPSVAIGPGVKIGENCLIYSHVTIRERCQIGNRVILQPGAVIGSCGFGYITNAQGKHTKLDQLGIVILEDDVEIGANTTIDRARFKTTRIGRGSKLDNLVQIAHNVSIGPDNIIISQSGIAGSAKTGKNVILGGQAGVIGHVELTDEVMIATRGGVSKSITEKGKYAGGPVMALSDYNRQQVYLRKIGEYVKRIEELEKKIEELTKSADLLRQ